MLNKIKNKNGFPLLFLNDVGTQSWVQKCTITVIGTDTHPLSHACKPSHTVIDVPLGFGTVRRFDILLLRPSSFWALKMLCVSPATLLLIEPRARSSRAPELEHFPTFVDLLQICCIKVSSKALLVVQSVLGFFKKFYDICFVDVVFCVPTNARRVFRPCDGQWLENSRWIYFCV